MRNLPAPLSTCSHQLSACGESWPTRKLDQDDGGRMHIHSTDWVPAQFCPHHRRHRHSKWLAPSRLLTDSSGHTPACVGGNEYSPCVGTREQGKEKLKLISVFADLTSRGLRVAHDNLETSKAADDNNDSSQLNDSTRRARDDNEWPWRPEVSARCRRLCVAGFSFGRLVGVSRNWSSSERRPTNSISLAFRRLCRVKTRWPTRRKRRSSSGSASNALPGPEPPTATR